MLLLILVDISILIVCSCGLFILVDDSILSVIPYRCSYNRIRHKLLRMQHCLVQNIPRLEQGINLSCQHTPDFLLESNHLSMFFVSDVDKNDSKILLTLKAKNPRLVFVWEL